MAVAHNLTIPLLVGNGIPVSDAPGIEKAEVSIAPAYEFQRDDNTVNWGAVVTYPTSEASLTITGMVDEDAAGDDVVWLARVSFLNRGQVVSGGTQFAFIFAPGAPTDATYPDDIVKQDVVTNPEYGPTWAQQAEAAKVAAQAAAAAAQAVGTTNDTIMASVASNPASAFSVATAARIGTAVTAQNIPGQVSSAVAAAPTVAAAAAAATTTAIAGQRLGFILVEGTGEADANLLVSSGTPTYAGTGRFSTAMNAGKAVSASGTVPEPTGPLTVEFVTSRTNATGVRVPVAFDGNLYFSTATTTGFPVLTFNGSAKVTGSVNICDGANHHIAFQIGRSGGITTYANMWVDGVPQGGTVTSTVRSWTDSVTLGGIPAVATFDWFPNGTIDELRISSTARYTGTFTPPASVFVMDPATVLLAHLDSSLYKRTGTGYPPRPTNAPAGAVTYKGSTTPTDMLALDDWLKP